MKMSQEQIERAINKMASIIKPNDVLDIEFDLDRADDNEYYMTIVYIVPDDSDKLRIKNMRESDFYRNKWNSSIIDNIKNYLGVNVIISSSGIKSESYYNNMKNR